jgi:hypothetical protein
MAGTAREDGLVERGAGGMALMEDNVRVLVGHEPRFYREALAAALAWLRPEAEIILVEPIDIDAEVERRRPHLVVCSRLSPVVRRWALAWVVLYPDAANLALVSVAGQERSVPAVEVDDLLAVFDEADQLVGGATGDDRF